MWKSLQLICVMAAMTVFSQYGMANDPAPAPVVLAEPDSEQEPDQDPEPEPVYERWLLTYDDYRSQAFPSDEGYLGLAREIEAVRRGDYLYLKGIFKEYPDFWTICHINGKELLFREDQLLSETSDGPVYFHYGKATYDWDSNYPSKFDLYSFQFSDREPISKLTISDDGTVIKDDKHSCFWYDDNTSGYLLLHFQYYWDEPYVDFPDTGYMVNMCFKKIGVGGVSDRFGDKKDDTAAPMYDMQGRRVNPETVRPGIYIRAGKKIIVR